MVGKLVLFAAVALMGVALVAAAVVDSEESSGLDAMESSTRKRLGKKLKVRMNCDKGWREVADHKCCPDDHPDFIEGDCYAPCEDGYDNFELGTYVGCRARCPAGHSSTPNQCSRGPNHHDREDIARSSVSAKVQKTPTVDTTTTCKRNWVKVAYNADKKGRVSGGCCPKSSPILIGRRCYSECPSTQEAIRIGDFIGCRQHCPAGADKESHNECTQNGETVERDDFPRDGRSPARRRKSKKNSGDVADGCKLGYVAASDTKCCPANRPVLIGLLCYEQCSRGYADSHFGCRRKCPRDWTQHALTCTSKSGHKSISRDGYERHPVVSSNRDKHDDSGAESSTGAAVGVPTPIATL